MLKKCTILGLAFLVVGGLAFGWLRQQEQSEQSETVTPASGYSLKSDEDLEKYGRWHELTPEEQNQLVLELDKDRQSKSQDEVSTEQQVRLQANLPRLAAGEMNPGDIADYLYGPGWEEKVVEYRKLKEQEQIVQTVSLVCLSIGGTLVGGCLILWILWSIVRGLKAIKRRRIARRRTMDIDPADLRNVEHEECAKDGFDADCPVMPLRAMAEETESESEPEPVAETTASENEEDEEFERFVIPRSHPNVPGPRATLATQPQTEDSAVAMLLTDEPASETEWSAQTEWSTGTPEASPQRARFTPRPKVPVLGEEWPDIESHVAVEESPAAEENPLTDQADGLQRQIAEFREMAQSVQQASREQSAPLSNTLKELAQQVSAIREYAASQQNRVEKLQDGYDWSIIRTFCLRVIRCVDNLENRIQRLAEDDEVVTQLDEVKDELLFALESSGIEQFRPEINSDYRGQEKWAEAIKEKEATKDSGQTGKIAKVIRPGYRYIIDDDSYKVVRTAQVKLFG